MNIADDDGFFLDHHGLFNHWRWDRWGAAVSIDLHALRCARALVAAVRHAIAIFVAITVHPAISCRHAANVQRAAARPRSTFYGA
ncbi:hypothetical protein D3C76_1576200 [compost metagenome]